MDKVISARVSEPIAYLFDSLAERLRKPKEKVLEEAIKFYSESVDEAEGVEFIRRSSGIWKRDETPEDDSKSYSHSRRHEFGDSYFHTHTH